MASTTSQKPRLRLRRATPADVPDLVRVHFDAFGQGVMHRLMYPGGPSEGGRARYAAAFSPPPAGDGDPSKPSPVDTFIMVAETLPVEGEAGGRPEIVAFAKWRLVKEPVPEDTLEPLREFTAAELGEGTNVEVYNAFIGGLHQLRRKWMKGDPCLRWFNMPPPPQNPPSPAREQSDGRLTLGAPPDLGLLACSSTRQRLGAGSALLAWGNELADREGKVAWLEASPAGYTLYRRFGYEDVEAQDLRVAELWGAVREEHENWGQDAAVDSAGPRPEGCFRNVVMKRLPRKAE